MIRFTQIILIVFISATVSAQPLNDSLLLHYPFNGNANDTSGNQFNGIVYGATLTTDRFGVLNSAYYFDGVDDYINFPNTDTLKPSLPVSFSMFVKHDDLEAENCVLFNTSFEDNRSVGVYSTIQNTTKKYALGFGDGTYNYGSSTRRSYISNSIIDTTDWQFVVFVVEDSANMKIYVDCHEFCGDYSGEGGSLVYSDSAGSIGRHDQDPWLSP